MALAEYTYCRCELNGFLLQYFIGLGEPLESTAAVEALANGCIFINPRFSGNLSNILQHMDKPTSRKVGLTH